MESPFIKLPKIIKKPKMIFFFGKIRGIHILNGFVSYEVKLSCVLKIPSLFTDELLMDKIRVARNLKTPKLESFSTMVNVDKS